LIDFIEDKNAIKPESEALENLYLQEINSILYELSDREQLVLTLRYGFSNPSETSFFEIGRRLGLSRQRAEQIEKKAIEKFKTILIQREFDLVTDILEQLPPRDRHIFELRYGLGDEKPKSLKKVEKKTGVNQEEIKKIEEEVLKKFSQYCFEHMG
jgi:DNA-directed RNA polymerase sigma subunit (sigma70/sigma32)